MSLLAVFHDYYYLCLRMDTKFATEVKGVKYFSLGLKSTPCDKILIQRPRGFPLRAEPRRSHRNAAGEGENIREPCLFVALGTEIDVSDRPGARVLKQLEYQI
jgi:hypothetical protein